MLTSQDLPQFQLNFDRYESQLEKIAKGNELQMFTAKTIENELARLERNQAFTQRRYDDHAEMASKSVASIHRQSQTCQRGEDKIKKLEADLAQCEENKKLIAEKREKYKGKMKGVEEPLKKIMDDKLVMQKKIDQQILTKCNAFLHKQSHPDITYIMERFIGILQKKERADPLSVERYLLDYRGLILALNRVEFTALSVNVYKNLLHELIGKRALNLGIVKVKGDGEYEPTGSDFPKNLADFLIFYKLLILLCKAAIAKHDEVLCVEALKKVEARDVRNLEEINQLNARIESLKKVFGIIKPDQGLKPLATALHQNKVRLMENHNRISAQLDQDPSFQIDSDESAQLEAIQEENPTDFLAKFGLPEFDMSKVGDAQALLQSAMSGELAEKIKELQETIQTNMAKYEELKAQLESSEEKEAIQAQLDELQAKQDEYQKQLVDYSKEMATSYIPAEHKEHFKMLIDGNTEGLSEEAIKLAESQIPAEYRGAYNLAKGLHADPEAAVKEMVPEQYKGAFEMGMNVWGKAKELKAQKDELQISLFEKAVDPVWVKYDPENTGTISKETCLKLAKDALENAEKGDYYNEDVFSTAFDAAVGEGEGIKKRQVAEMLNAMVFGGF